MNTRGRGHALRPNYRGRGGRGRRARGRGGRGRGARGMFVLHVFDFIVLTVVLGNDPTVCIGIVL